MASPVFVHGKDGTVTVGGNLFNVTKFTYKEQNHTADITHSGAAGYQVLLKGVTMASGTLTFVYDTANQPTVSPYDMTTGTTLSLILRPEGTKPYTFSAISQELSWDSGPAAGAVNCTVNYSSTGTITRPSS